MIDVALLTVTLPEAVLPKLPVVLPATNPVPVSVTLVPPAVGPADGLTPVTVGGGSVQVKRSARQPLGFASVAWLMSQSSCCHI